MITLLSAVGSLLSFRLRSRASLELELVALRHQVTVLRRQCPGRPRLFSTSRPARHRGRHLRHVFDRQRPSHATLTDVAKFDRLAARLGASSSAAKSELRKRFESDAERVHQYRTRAVVAPIPWGPSRIDAIALIVNRLVASTPRIPENWSTPLAPTKPPFVWNSPQGAWTQWRGVQQDPISRNLTETMGVFMPMDLTSKTPGDGLFDSGANVLNLQKIENWLQRLAPPKWPEEVLGQIDRKKALEGKALFVDTCASCHNAWPYTWTEPNKYGKRFVRVGLVPQTSVGTDPSQFQDLRPYAITAQLSSHVPPPYQGKDMIPTGALYRFMEDAVLDRSADSRSAWLSRVPAAASTGGCVQGSTARRSVGYAAIPA